MHQTRAQASSKIPIPRKGTKYVARASSDLENSVPVVVAVRDMLKLARTTKEVQQMIKQKSLRINGKEVKDYRESIKVFNVLEAGKSYVLTLMPTGKFIFEEASSKERICKVVNKHLFKGKKIQLNLHDGTNILAKEKINVHDTIYLNFSGKITKHIPFEKGKECFIISGGYLGQKGKIESIENGKAVVKFKHKTALLEKRRIIAL